MTSLVTRSAEGDRIQDIANNLPPLPVEGFTKSIQVVTYFIVVLATIVIALRVYVRFALSGSQRWGWDDIFAVGGWVPLIPSVAFLIIATNYGLGAHDSQVPDGMLEYYQVRVKLNMFCFELIYFASSVLTKLAMAIMILRLSATKFYVYIIWGNMAVLAVNALVCVVILFASCSPIQTLWNPKMGTCRIKDGWIIISYSGSIILAMVDWTCAITPFFMLRNLQMPKRRKISIQLILSLGIIGSAAGLVRMGYYHAYDIDKYPTESLYSWGQTILWSILEAGLGIITCSLPPLRRLFKQFYQSSSAESGKRSKLGTMDGATELVTIGGGKTGGITSIRRKEGSKWDRLDDEISTSSQQYIVKSTQVIVETSSAEDDKPRAPSKESEYPWASPV
ncbi:hypothetical protein F4818DRAFT_434311 [Hypoxylon cercidicola]|nr:hypothetical protein F4818DRAFT_434311 [Hypoxylon cercidicola]